MTRFPIFILSLSLMAGCAHKEPKAVEVPVIAVQKPRLGIPNERQADRQVTTGGQPTREQIKAAQELGYRTVINLRRPSEPGYDPEEESIVNSLGMRYVHLPIVGPDGITKEDSAKISAALKAADSRPALMHCGTGNRAGAMLALRAYFDQGKTPDEAVAIGVAAGLTRSEGAVRRVIEAAELAKIKELQE